MQQPGPRTGAGVWAENVEDPALRQVLHCTGKNPGQHTFIRLHSAPVTELLIVTSVPDKGCSMPQGDKQTVMGLMNKQDYARWHSYQFHCSIGDVDPTIRPAGALDVSTQPAPRPPKHVASCFAHTGQFALLKT